MFRRLLPLLFLAAATVAAEPRLRLAATWESGTGSGDESLGYQAATRRLAVGNGALGRVRVLSLADPAAPEQIADLDLALPAGHSLNGIDFHPSENLIAAAVAAPGDAPGEARLLDADSGAVRARYPTGVDPDGIHFSPDGRQLAVPNEAENYRRAVGGGYASAPGSVTLVELGEDPEQGRVVQVALPPLPMGHGLTVESDQRLLEREVDGREVEIPFDSGDPAHLEPEHAAFAPDGATVYVSLQENNGVALIDVASGSLSGVYALGTVKHAADLEDDGAADFSETLTAFREPDQIAVTPDGRYLVTADEGDTDPKASKSDWGPAGGGRTVSVLDAATGEVLGDTGSQLDEAAAAAGVYPDGRSDNKGSEPEGLVVFAAGDGIWAVVGLERAEAVALIDLADPRAPQVRAVQPLRREGESGKLAPEDLAYIHQDGAHYVATANEKSGTVSIVAVEF